jgi:hypothetical protein
MTRWYISQGSPGEQAYMEGQEIAIAPVVLVTRQSPCWNRRM